MGVAIFAVQNASRVDINFFIWQLQNISLVVVILGSALFGAVAAGLFGAVKQIKLRMNLKSCKNLAEGQTAEIEYLQKKLKEHESDRTAQMAAEADERAEDSEAADAAEAAAGGTKAPER